MLAGPHCVWDVLKALSLFLCDCASSTGVVFFIFFLKRKDIFWWFELNYVSVSSRWCMTVPCDCPKGRGNSWNFLETAQHSVAKALWSEHAQDLRRTALMVEKWYASLTACKKSTKIPPWSTRRQPIHSFKCLELSRCPGPCLIMAKYWILEGFEARPSYWSKTT